jgi:2-keto-3-deoxy-L-rhamnonate aldolase RhmA
MLECQEMKEAVERLVTAAHERKKILGMFLFGPEEIPKFHKLGFRMFSLGNDLHHVLNTSSKYLSDVEAMKDSKNHSLWKKPKTNM